MADQRQRPAKRHHLVSKFYLRHFASEKDRVTTVLLPGERSYLQSVDDASVENDFYTAIGHDGQKTDAAEQAFNEIEAPAAEAWRLIAAGVWPLPTAEREVVAGWVALHLLRGHRARASMSNIGTDLLQLEIAAGGRARLRESLRELGEPHDDDSVTREWISLFDDPLVVAAHPNHHLSHIASVLPRAGPTAQLTSAAHDRCRRCRDGRLSGRVRQQTAIRPAARSRRRTSPR